MDTHLISKVASGSQTSRVPVFDGTEIYNTPSGFSCSGTSRERMAETGSLLRYPSC